MSDAVFPFVAHRGHLGAEGRLESCQTPPVASPSGNDNRYSHNRKKDYQGVMIFMQ
ncbi:MAG: hypothetical protein RH946_19620 [Rhodospirillales bacterium]